MAFRRVRPFQPLQPLQHLGGAFQRVEVGGGQRARFGGEALDAQRPAALHQSPPRFGRVLDRPEDPAFDHPGSILYFRVDDVRAAYDALRARGAAFIDEPHMVHEDGRHELWMAFFHDTEGNTLAVASEVPK